jgi:hypothetical protein
LLSHLALERLQLVMVIELEFVTDQMVIRQTGAQGWRKNLTDPGGPRPKAITEDSATRMVDDRRAATW